MADGKVVATAVVGGLTITANIIILIINLLATSRRAAAERAHKLEFEFYKICVIESLPPLIAFSNDAQSIVWGLLNDFMTKQCSRDDAQEKCKKLDEIQYQLNECKEFYRIRGFSPEMYDKCEDIVSTYYDAITTVISKCANHSIDGYLAEKTRGNFKIITITYFNDLSKAMRQKEHKVPF